MPTAKKNVVKKKAVKAKKVVRTKAKKATKRVAGTKKKITARKAIATRKKTVKHATKKKQCMCKKCCEPQESFWVNDGPVVASVVELKHALQTMSTEQYTYHTKRNGNDFARWLRDCLEDNTHAVQLEKAKTKAEAVRVLGARCCKK